MHPAVAHAVRQASPWVIPPWSFAAFRRPGPANVAVAHSLDGCRHAIGRWSTASRARRGGCPGSLADGWGGHWLTQQARRLQGTAGHAVWTPSRDWKATGRNDARFGCGAINDCCDDRPAAALPAEVFSWRARQSGAAGPELTSCDDYPPCGCLISSRHSFGKMTESITWITPLVHSMSVATSLALSTITASSVTMTLMLCPCNDLIESDWTTLDAG